MLYRLGGAAALLTAVFIPIQIAVYIIWPPPTDPLDWFVLLQNNRFAGLVDLDLLLLVDQALLIPVFLALYALLRRIDQAWTTVGTILGLVAIVTYLGSNPAFSMLVLSNKYAAATTEAEQAMLLAAGQAILTMFEGSAFYAYYVLGSIAPIIVCAVMLRTTIFGRAIPYLGIVANVVSLCFFLPVVGLLFSLLSVLMLEIWYVLIGRRLLRLARSALFPVAGSVAAMAGQMER